MTNTTSLPLHADATRALRYRLMLLAAGIAAAVSLVTAVLITVDFLRDRRESPLAAANVVGSKEVAPRHAPALIAELKALHVRLAAKPDDEQVKGQIREIDLTLRRLHFQRRARIAGGAWILVASLSVMVMALKVSTQVGARAGAVVGVFPPPQDFWQAASAARWPIVVMASAFVVALGVAAYEGPGLAMPELAVVKNTSAQGGAATEPGRAKVPVKLAGPTDSGAPLAEMLANWPSFRGAMGTGVSADTGTPTSWDGAKGTNVLWKTAVLLAGNNSPVVWKNRVFCAGASADAQAVYCFDADSGTLVWQAPVIGPVAGSSVTLNEETGFAPSTLATDGRRVYAIFPTGDVVALDFAGKEVWSKNLGKPDNMYGHASSLAVCEGRLIIQFDQGSDAEAKKSCLLALDGATGGELWKTPRMVAQSWASPIVIYPESGAQIVTASKPLMAVYDAKDGHQLYSAAVLDGDVAPSPAFGNGKIYVATDQSPLAAFPATSHGDVTNTPLWTGSDGLPDIVSPLATPELVLLVTGRGRVTAYEPEKGKTLWDHDFDCDCHASPVLANKRIYLVDRAGVTHIFDSAGAFHEWPACPLGEAVSATPAFLNNRIYIRAKSNLYCIGTK